MSLNGAIPHPYPLPPCGAAVLTLDATLYSLETLIRAAYDLLGRWDVEIHPLDTQWRLLAARVQGGQSPGALSEQQAQEAARWEISTALILASVAGDHLARHASLREGLARAAFLDAALDLWQLAVQALSSPAPDKEGAPVGRIEDGRLFVRRETCALWRIMWAASRTLQQCAAEVSSQGDEICIALRPPDTGQSARGLLEQLQGLLTGPDPRGTLDDQLITFAAHPEVNG